MTNKEKLENLLENANYVVEGTLSGWLDVPDSMIQFCILIKQLSENNYDKLFKFKEKGYEIKYCYGRKNLF